jgi:[protein-PII] uridylyltransferase
VLNHLALSDAAFRKNPRVPSTWRELVDLGVVGKRLPRLAIFTAIDILGTNPDAWSSWKERLLKDLVDVMASSPALNFAELMASLRREHGKVNWEFMQQLDPAVIDSISKSILAKEYIQLRSCERKKRQSLDPLVIMDRERRMWVRLHVRQDEPGVFAELLKKLYSLGLRINYAAAQTYEKWGVYDWFQVASHKRVAWVRNQLSIVLKSGRVQVSLPEVLFRKVTVVSESDQEVVISFRGKDRPGALAVSAQALSEEGFDILWARAHTWGRQLDDSFGVRPIAGLNGRLENICEKLLQVPVAKTQGGTSR